MKFLYALIYVYSDAVRTLTSGWGHDDGRDFSFGASSGRNRMIAIAPGTGDYTVAQRYWWKGWRVGGVK